MLQVYGTGVFSRTDWPLFINRLADDINDASKSLFSYWHLHNDIAWVNYSELP